MRSPTLDGHNFIVRTPIRVFFSVVVFQSFWNILIDYPFMEISMFQKDWNTTTEKKVVSTHPHLEEIKITVQGTEVIASPFKKTNPKENKNRHSNLKDIKGIQQQIIIQIRFRKQFLLNWTELRRTFRNQKIQNMKNLYSNLQNIINLLN